MLRHHGRYCICSKCEENDCNIKSLEDYTKLELIIELSKRGVRVLELAKNESYCIASEERHCIFGNNAKQILVVIE